MKRSLMITAMLASAAVLTGCAGSGKTLYEHGMDVVTDMHALAADSDYAEAMLGGATDEMAEIIEHICSGDHTVPIAVYEIGPADEVLEELLDSADMKLTEEQEHIITARLFGSVASQINAGYGVSALAASSAFTGSKLFVSDEAVNGTLYLYVFEDAYPVLMTFTQGEDGASSASGMFLLGDGFDGLDGEELTEQLSDIFILRDADFTKLDIG